MDYQTDFSMTAYEKNRRRKVQETYRRKYLALKRKCDLIEVSNERVLNRLCHVKKYMHRLSRERRGLAKKLTELGDEFKKTDWTIPLEDDLPSNMLGVSESPSSSGHPLGEGNDAASLLGTIETEDGASLDLQLPAPPTHSKSGKKKRAKDASKGDKEKDPNAPKKPANAFLMYCQQERQKVQDKEGNGIYPADLSHQDLTRQLAKQWKFLSEEEKKHYYTMYEKEKDLYDVAVKNYVKAGADKKSVKPEEEGRTESETIDVVKLGHERDIKRKEIIKEVKITMKASSSNEDQNIDVEKDEFEFTDCPIDDVMDEPKICLEKIDKSKLFDKARLFGLPSADYKTEKTDSVTKGVPVRDLLLSSGADMKMPPRMPRGMDFRPSILEIKPGQKSAIPTSLSAHLGPRMSAAHSMPVRSSGELTIKEVIGMSAGAAFDLKNQPMMELKSKSPCPTEDGTVLASALRNKSMFDMKPRTYTSEPTTSKTAIEMVTIKVDSDRSATVTLADATSKPHNMASADVKSHISDFKAKPDSKPRVFSDSKGKSSPEMKTKPATGEARSPSATEVRVKPSPEVRRMSLDNKKPVVELRKIAMDPSDDPYHFDD